MRHQQLVRDSEIAGRFALPYDVMLLIELTDEGVFLRGWFDSTCDVYERPNHNVLDWAAPIELFHSVDKRKFDRAIEWIKAAGHRATCERNVSGVGCTCGYDEITEDNR